MFSRSLKSGMVLLVPGKPKTIKQLVRAGICPYAWSIHFKRRPDKATCRDCLDFKNGFCKGGTDPISCFKKQKPFIHQAIGEFDNGSGHPRVAWCEGDCRKCGPLLKLLSTPSTVVSLPCPDPSCSGHLVKKQS